MRVPTIALVVEGPGDVTAAPILVSRILSKRFGRWDVSVAHGQDVVRANGRPNLEARLESFLGYAFEKPGCAAILVLLDADNDCPVELKRRLSERSSRLGLDCPVEIACARRSYETWFLASLDTISGERGLTQTTGLTHAAEDVANPKRWLTDQMPPGRAYKETTDQPALSEFIDLEAAHANSRSFRRLCHAIELLLGGMNTPAA